MIVGTLAVPRWGKGHLTTLACYGDLRSRFTQERVRFQNSPFGGRAGLASLRTWPCHATRRGFPTGPLPPYREERQREVVLSGRPALLLVALVVVVMALGLIGVLSAVSARQRR
jgi:hypothetical protein